MKTDLNIEYRKDDCTKNVFFYCKGKLDLILKKRDRALTYQNTASVCNKCNYFSTFLFLILLKYK